MIMPSSCAGTPKRAKGCSICSTAAVRSSVVVVMVMRLMPIIIKMIRQPTNRHECTLPVLISMMPHLNSVSPLWSTKRFSSAQISAIAMSGASERMALPNGMRDTT